MANWIELIDQQIGALLADWSILTTLLALVVAALVAYPIVFSKEPDTHPLLLARQSTSSPVRNRYESAVYRSPDAPHGYPLRTGLGVKDPGAPKWAAGRDGDLRDVWREVLSAGTSRADGKVVPAGKILTVLGKTEVVEHEFSQLTKEIEIIGSHLKGKGCKRVAIYLPNSVEYLLTVFACSFYGVSPILLPYNLPHPKVYEMLVAAEANGLIAAAGTLPLDKVAKSCPDLKLLTWVVEKTSRHMDWNGVPESASGRLSVSVWHDVVQENLAGATAKLPDNDSGDPPRDLISVWQPKPIESKPEIVTLTQGNIVSGIAGLLAALPIRQRFAANDLVLPASSFNITYVLCQTLAALTSHASLAITSVAEPGVDFEVATRGVSPTVVIASAETLARLHAKEAARQVSLPQKLDKYTQSQDLLAGRMPSQSLLFRFLAPPVKVTSNEPGHLRLILTAERLGAGTPPLTSDMLSDLRIFTRARICYALTAARVAGAISQTNVFDYRRESGVAGHGHFGVPLSCVEIKLTNPDDDKLGTSQPEGELTVSGPEVSGGEARLGMSAKIRSDGTLSYA